MDCILQETFGECPYLSGSLAQHYVWGLQGEHPRYERATAGCKHFDVHGGPDNIPVSRHSFNAKVNLHSALSKIYDLLCQYVTFVSTTNFSFPGVNARLENDIPSTVQGLCQSRLIWSYVQF